MGDPVSGSSELADADFIAAARDAIPALLAALAEAQRERDEARWHQERCHRHHEASDADLAAARADAERMRPVVEAARAWRAAELPPDAHNKVYRALNALAIAVDAYEHPEDTYESQTGGTE
jgi:hypothetical protein